MRAAGLTIGKWWAADHVVGNRQVRRFPTATNGNMKSRLLALRDHRPRRADRSRQPRPPL